MHPEWDSTELPLSHLKDLRKDRPQILLHEPRSTERARMNEGDQEDI
jgi:hypothetical protein